VETISHALRERYIYKRSRLVLVTNAEMRNNEEGEHMLNTNTYTTKDTCKPQKQKGVHKIGLEP